MTTEANEPAPLAGLVLAGGYSRRMGCDKAALEIHGQPQVRVCAELLHSVLDSVHVSIRPDQAGLPVLEGWPLIHDRIPGAGPMAGVLAAMDDRPGTAWLVLACDLPFAARDAVRALLHGRDPAREATAFMATDGFFEPLFAIYEPAIRRHLDEYAAAGRYSLREALTDHDVRLLCPPDDRVLTNINTPQDLAEARALLAATGWSRG